jgi:hypothetical protein
VSPNVLFELVGIKECTEHKNHDHTGDVGDAPRKADGNETAIGCSVEAVEGASTGCVLLLKNGDAEPVESRKSKGADMEEQMAPPKQNIGS